MFSPYQLSSDCKNYPPEGAAFNEITQGLSRFDQRERLRHDRFDRTGLKERDNGLPSVSNRRLRLTEHIEPPDAAFWHHQTLPSTRPFPPYRLPQSCVP